MDTQAIRAQMPTLVRGHVPSNIRSFKFNIFDGHLKHDCGRFSDQRSFSLRSQFMIQALDQPFTPHVQGKLSP